MQQTQTNSGDDTAAMTNGMPLNGVRRATLGVGVIAFLVYLLSAVVFDSLGVQPFAYYDLQAFNWLQGELTIDAPQTHDLTYYQGDWYLPFPPLPALLLLPWIFVSGTPQIDTVLFSIVLGAVNVMLTFQVLAALAQQGYSRLGMRANLWLTLLFALGSVHWMITLQGTVWFLAQISAYTFLALALLLTLKQVNPLWGGLALALAMLARPHIALAVPAALAILWYDAAGLRQFMQRALLFSVPMLLGVLGLFVYNQARFDNWRDFGYATQNVDRTLRADLAQYGQFNLHFVPRNTRVLLWAPPAYDEELDGWWPDRQGMSLFLTSPALLALAFARPRASRRLLFGALWLSVVLLLIPLLTYYNTGWWQFGYRFALDFLLLLLMILALGGRRRQLSTLFKLLVVAGVLINLWGTVWFEIIT